jgi:hypothetical protein
MARPNTNETLIRFDEPVLSGGEEIREVVMRRATVGDLADAGRLAGKDATRADIEVMLYALLTGIPQPDLLRCWESQYDALCEGYLFLRAGGRPAANSSENSGKACSSSADTPAGAGEKCGE